MYLELAEALDCPECRQAFGLVAFVGHAEGRRVVTGRLGCPLCEIEFPIADGAIDFGAETPAEGASGPGGEDLPVRLAALLGIGDRSGMVVLLGPGLGAYGPQVARLAERAEVISWLAGADPTSEGAPDYELTDLEAGFDPVRRASETSWPIRTGFLDGVALGSSAAPCLDEAARCLKPGGRLVIVASESEAWLGLAERGFRELARDAATWVGERA